MGSCRECKRWVPDAFIVAVGTCDKMDKPLLERQGGCEYYCLKIEEDFMWCEDCRTTVHRSEFGRHRGHFLCGKVRVDPDSSEYLPAGD